MYNDADTILIHAFCQSSFRPEEICHTYMYTEKTDQTVCLLNAFLLTVCNFQIAYLSAMNQTLKTQTSHQICTFSVHTVEFQWLEHLWNQENMFETGVVRANECQSQRQVRRHYRDSFSIFCNLKVILCVLIRIASSRRF